MNNVEVIQVGVTKPTEWNRQQYRVYSPSGLSPCLNTVQGGGLEPKIVCDMEKVKIISNPHGFNKGGEKDIAPACTSSAYQDNNFIVEPNDWQTIVGNKQLNPFRGSVEGASPCITSACGAGGGTTPMLTDADLETTKSKEFVEQVRGHEEMRYRIRKLTTRECFRLMGVDDADIDKIQASGISNSQQYKCAGNSIVVDVLYHLFRKMFVEKGSEEATYQQELF